MVLYAITMDQVIILLVPPIITYVYMTRNIRFRCVVTRVQRYAPARCGYEVENEVGNDLETKSVLGSRIVSTATI